MENNYRKEDYDTLKGYLIIYIAILLFGAYVYF
jgi:hypothetical protein